MAPLPTTLTSRSIPRGASTRHPTNSSRSRASDHHEPEPGQTAVGDEQDHRGVDHQPVGERVGDLPEARLDMPAAREEAVDLVCDAGDAEDDPRRPAGRVPGPNQHGHEDGDEREAAEGQRVRVRARAGPAQRGSPSPHKSTAGCPALVKRVKTRRPVRRAPQIRRWRQARSSPQAPSYDRYPRRAAAGSIWVLSPHSLKLVIETMSGSRGDRGRPERVVGRRPRGAA